MPPLQPESHAHADAGFGRTELLDALEPSPTVAEVVEARTAEDAVAEVHRRFGPGARIVHAEKVLRGGIGGFFARELVQLTVELPSPEPPTGDVRVIPARPSTAGGVDGARSSTTPRVSTAGDRDPVGTTTVAASTDAGERGDAPANPLRAVLEAGVDDGPPGETFGELLDRRAAQRTGRTDPLTPSPSAGGSAGAGGAQASVAGGPGARPDVIERLTWETDARERTFGDVLRSTMLGDLAGTSTDSASSPASAGAPRTASAPGVATSAPAGASSATGVASTTGASTAPRQVTAPAPPASRPSAASGRAGEVAPGATIAGDDGTLLRGAASLIRDTPLRGGAAQLVVAADRIDVTDRPVGADPGAARLASARQAAVDRIDAAIAAANERTAPATGRAGHDLGGAAGTGTAGGRTADSGAASTPRDDEDGASQLVAPGPSLVAVGSSIAAAADPLGSRHEAFRQLRASLEPGPTLDATAPTATGPAVAPTRRPRTLDASRASSAWSADALARAGAPAEVVECTLALSPSDDVQWFGAVARALEPFCGPLPSGPEVVVGPRARRLAPHLAAEVMGAEDHPAPGRSVVLPHRRTPDTRRWLAEERGDRGLHMVVGGTGWRDWLFELPDVVSWTRPEDLADALDTVTRFRLVLGWQLGRDVARRATPIDLAVALRARVVGR